jgi:hypothetical protein
MQYAYRQQIIHEQSFLQAHVVVPHVSVNLVMQGAALEQLRLWLTATQVHKAS